MDPVYAYASSLMLACVFAGAALHKWRDAAAFREILAGYRILPSSAITLFARLLPVLEMAAALALIVPDTNSVAAWLCAILLLVYSAAIAINLLRGRRALDCGCGGRGQSLNEWLLLRNGLLLLLAWVAGSAQIERQLGWMDYGVTLFAAAVGVLCYQIANQLLANGEADETARVDHA